MDYPVLQSRQKRHVYSGHSGPVRRAVFSFDSRYVLSMGSSDCAIFKWVVIKPKHEEPEPAHSRNELNQIVK